ncbi:ABC transporter permease [soil metagenome]
MNWRIVRLVSAKELRETLRDRRTLLIMIVVPVFLYPVLLVMMQQLTLFGQRTLQEQPPLVQVAGGAADAAAFLREDTLLRVMWGELPSEEAVREGRIDAVLLLPTEWREESTNEIRIVYDASRERSRYARERLQERLSLWGDSLLAQRLEARGLPASLATPLAVADSSVASPRRVGGSLLGQFLPLLLIMMTLLGAFYPAIDMAAGEKERGTLETLLTSPVPAREIVAGKFIAVTLIALAAAALNLGSMLLTFQSGIFQFTRGAGIEFSLPPQTALFVLVLLVPLAVLFAALFLGIAVRSQSFKEAQHALTPVQLASILPASLPLIPGIPLSYGLALVPVGGVAVLCRELMTGEAPLGPALVALGSTVFYALLALRFAARSFGHEEVLFGSESGSAVSESLLTRVRGWRTAAAAAPRPAASLAFIGVVALLYFYLGVPLQLALGERGLLLAQWLLLALPALAFAALGPYDLRRTLALRAPPPRALLAALLILAGGLPLGWMIAWLQTWVLPLPEELVRALQQMVVADSGTRLVWVLFLVALTPAICEELVFRGVLLQGFARELSQWRAVIGSAVIFGAFHLSTETVIRFLPTMWIGLLLGYVAWHTRSIYASMLMHFANNATAVLLISIPVLRAQFSDPQAPPPWLPIALAPLLLWAGLRLLPKRPAEAAAPEPTGAARGLAEPQEVHSTTLS